MQRCIFVLACLTSYAFALTPIPIGSSVANSIRAALDGDALLKTALGGDEIGVVQVTVRPCTRANAPSCAVARTQRAAALATLLALAEPSQGLAVNYTVKAVVTFNGKEAKPGAAPQTADEATQLLTSALSGNIYFNRVVERTLQPTIPGRDFTMLVFNPRIVQYVSTDVYQLGALTTLPAAQLFEKVFDLKRFNQLQIRATTAQCRAKFACRKPL